MVKTRALVFAIASLGALAAACEPDLPGRASVVDAPRVLAIKSEPAEANPNANPPTAITWSALYVGPDGNEDPSRLDFSLCTERKPLATAGEISLACLVPQGDALVDLGSGAEVMGTLPDDGCRQFGPNPPPPKPGEPAPRPTDADASGGFYQPLRVAAAEAGGYEYSVGLTRISCGIPRATSGQVVEFNQRYRANENPKLSGVVVAPDHGELPLTGDPDTTAVVEHGARVALRASWPDCPTEPTCGDGICGEHEDKSNCKDDCAVPHGCGGSEPYVSFDLKLREVVARRESIRVSWYSTAGSFDHDRSGRTEDEAAIPYSDNGWTAPSKPGDVRLWVVLRDDRGGVDYASYFVRVE